MKRINADTSDKSDAKDEAENWETTKDNVISLAKKRKKRYAEGAWVDPEGSGTYVGEFKDGRFHGQGTWTGSAGEKYVGEWQDGTAHGRGTLTWPSGLKYVGEFEDDN